MAKVKDGEIRGKVRSGLGNVVVYGEKDDVRVRSVGVSTKHVRMVIERYRAIAKVDRKKRAVEQEDDWTGKKLEWGM